MKTVTIMFTLLLVACGGGGGEDTPPAANNDVRVPEETATPADTTTTQTSGDCPEYYAMVQALAPYTTKNFCISQYEMRQTDAGTPIPSHSGEPWKLPRDPAQRACHSIGMALPTNAQWQTMARQAEGLAINWTSGHVGAGSLIASPTILSNGAVVYNLGNGVWEQVSGDLREFAVDMVWQTSLRFLDDTTHPYPVMMGGVEGRAKYHFGPAGDYRGYSYDPGLGEMTNRYSFSIMRGGDDEEPGMFGTALNHGPEDISNDVGFRCVLNLYGE